MNYHDIKHDDMLNGDGLRVTLFVSGCSHNCPECQNPQTHDPKSGILFDIDAIQEIYEQLDHDYISGLTLSGGDPLYENNLPVIQALVMSIKHEYPEKTIWIYSGYTYEAIIDMGDSVRRIILSYCDVFVDGPYVNELRDVNAPWRGSTNQRVIDLHRSTRDDIVLWSK